MTNAEITKELDTISKLSHYEMCRLWRFAPAGHPYFDRRLPLFASFEQRFKHFGGFTPKISKELG